MNRSQLSTNQQAPRPERLPSREVNGSLVELSCHENQEGVQTVGLQDSGAVPSTDTRIPETNNAESLSTVLTQGLRSQDLRLIDRCLASSDEGIVKSTVARLEAADAGTLLEVCVSKMQARVNRGANLALWIRAVLLRHTAYLMATPGQQQVLSELQQSIENRLALQQPLAMLSGRLDLLLAQTLTRKEGGDGSYQVSSPADIQDSETSSEESEEEDEESSEED